MHLSKSNFGGTGSGMLDLNKPQGKSVIHDATIEPTDNPGFVNIIFTDPSTGMPTSKIVSYSKSSDPSFEGFHTLTATLESSVASNSTVLVKTGTRVNIEKDCTPDHYASRAGKVVMEQTDNNGNVCQENFYKQNSS